MRADRPSRGAHNIAHLRAGTPASATVLVLYDQYSTFTNTVLDHLRAFGLYSRYKHVYCHGQNPAPRVDWDRIDAVLIHYCLRVAFEQIPQELQDRLAAFQGPKILFVQDEYDLTENTRKAIERLGIAIVFTCVPQAYRDLIYPASRFPGVDFETTLTGYIPLDLEQVGQAPAIRERPLLIAYRGRALPYYYGDLGQEKLVIAQRMRQACTERGMPCDIEWDDSRRIYGTDWPRFLMSAKATLGTESGCNLFDDDGSLRAKVGRFLQAHPSGTYDEARRALFGDQIEQPIMNQISPRFFEAICYKTALVLFEGNYSGVLQPWRHFIPLRKDFSNLEEVFAHLRDDIFLQEMVDRTFQDVVQSERFTYRSFIRGYDTVLSAKLPQARRTASKNTWGADVTETPVRSNPVPPPPRWMSQLWNALPGPLREHLHHRVVRMWMAIKQ